MSAAELRLRAVEEDPAAVDPVREQRGVLVLGMPDDAVALDGAEVLGRGEKDGRAGRTVGGAGDHPALELVDPDDARVLEAPLLARRPSSGASSGSGSTAQPSTPFAERATVRCEMPRRSSTRASSTVSPSTMAAAGLKTAFTGIRPVVRSQNRVGGVALEELAGAHARTGSSVRSLAPARTPAASRRRAAWWNASVDSAPSLSFSPIGSEPVAAAAGREVVERSLQAVAAQEPFEGASRADSVLGFVRAGERGQLRLDERGGVERLLVALPRCRLASAASAVPGKPASRAVEPALVAEPAQRLERRARRGQVGSSALAPTRSACESRALS